MKSKRLYITMSIFIVLMVGGGTFISVYFEDIQIKWYIWKLDSEDKAEKNKAFEWLKTIAKDNLEDKRLKAFFKHPESLEQVEFELDEMEKPLSFSTDWKKPSLFSAVENGDLVDLKIML